MIRYIMTYFKTWGKPMLVLGGLILIGSVGFRIMMSDPMLMRILFLVVLISTMLTPLIPLLFIILGIIEKTWLIRLSLLGIGLIGSLDTINHFGLRQFGYDVPFPFVKHLNEYIYSYVFLEPSYLVWVILLGYGVFCYIFRFRGKAIQEEAKKFSKEPMKDFWSKKAKQIWGWLLPILVLSTPLLWYGYTSTYQHTEVYRDENNVTGHTLLFEQVGEPVLFSGVNVKLTLLDENNRKVETVKSSIANDGGSARVDNISVNWLGHSVRVTLSGDEQQDEVHVLEFD